ncbi:MAG: ABC transporter substrate-binding protein [Holosporaceae bacterium]|jgi:putative ABC transport system substrate-binding protein|nr:ABC transporter substrate-binding protein [Holosporaceae bacterium]
MKKTMKLLFVILPLLIGYGYFTLKNNMFDGNVFTNKSEESLDDREAKKYTSLKIRICKAVEHEALNAVVKGMRDYLSKQQGKEYDISIETCQGNMAMAAQIISKFASSGADIVVTVGTSPSQCAFPLARSGKIRLVFSSVTNPGDISPNLTNSNTVGVSNFVPLEPQLELFRKIQPKLKNLGIIYNTGEANSASIIKKLRPICKKIGIRLMEQGIMKVSDIPQAAEKLAKIVDAVFISNDNTTLSGIPNIVTICSKYRIPVYVSDTDQVEKGCVAALGPNQYDIGVQTGKIIQRIADGYDINEMRVEYPDVTELYLNEKGPVKIPDDIKHKAKKIF